MREGRGRRGGVKGGGRGQQMEKKGMMSMSPRKFIRNAGGGFQQWGAHWNDTLHKQTQAVHTHTHHYTNSTVHYIAGQCTDNRW